MSRCNVVASDARKSTMIGDLPNDILHRVLELIPIQDAAKTSILSKRWTQIWSTQPHLVFDRHFFQYVSNKDASVASIIHKILMQHTGNILGFHLMSKTHELSQSDVDQCIIFVSKQGIQKLTLDLAKSNAGKYSLPCRIFTCSTLTHLKLSRCIFKVPDGTQFPNLVCLELNRSEVDRRRGSEGSLILPMLEILKLRCCIGVSRVNIFAPKIENLSIVSSYTVTFQCFNVNPIFTSIKHLCFNGTSLEVDETLSQTTKLLSYLSREENHVNEALRMIRTVRLRKFKGSKEQLQSLYSCGELTYTVSKGTDIDLFPLLFLGL
ncbi:F-box/LRR-repeat protein 25-like [Nicotiana tomentosiformis]|uniref:F-box/LRR-repeat protein 25-like n=1 Tax=Nicotiana tomentosiformis TaxID=4098 RepID=UPI00388C3762